jgi:tetratricopeptide (TPR) repeat protein
LLALANITGDQGRHAAADSLYRASLAAYAAVFGDDAPDLARVKNDFAGRLIDRGEFARAEPLYREALPVYAEVLGDGHPFTAIVKGNLASALYPQAKTDEAERLWRQAIETLRGANIDQGFAATRMVDLAVLLMDRADNEEAEQFLRDALEIYRPGLPETRWPMVETQSSLGACLAGQGRFEEAEPLLLDSFTALRDERGLDHASTQLTITRLVSLYVEWGRSDDAESYRRMLLDGREG